MNKRIVSWFSCGVTSAIATKRTIEKYQDKYPIVIAYCNTHSEHPDNMRFASECAEWFDIPITVLSSEGYYDIWDVFEKTRWLNGIEGARCSQELKKKVRQNFEDLEHDIQIFGFDIDEEKRAKKFKKNNPEVTAEFPLIDLSISKSDCIVEIQSVGIELPIMYKLGYKNNNCIGCVKGAKGYWNKIRKDFPDTFDRMAKKERELNHALNITGTKKRGYKHIFLDELPENAGRYKSELPIQCGLFCGEL